MKSLWTKFLTGIAAAGMLMTNVATVSAGGNKGFSFGGGGSGGSSMRSHSSGSSGSQSMKSFARSLSSSQGGGNSFKSSGSNNSSNGSSLSRSLNQFKAQGGNNNQFSNLSKALKSNSRPNLSSQSLGNSNQFKSMQRIGQLNQGQNKAFDQMLRGAQTFHGNKNSNKSQSLQALMGGQFGNKDFNPAKFNGPSKHNSNNNFFAGLDKHANHLKKDFFFGDHHHDHHDHGHHDHHDDHHHGHHHHHNLWWGWNDPWCYKPTYYNSYPYYGSYPYYNSSVSPIASVPTPAVPAVTPQVPQLALADLVLADLRVMEPGNGTDQGPLFQISIANQGPSASPPFQAAIVAAVSKEQLDSAVKAEAQVGPIQPGQTTKVEVRLPIEAMALQGPNGPTMFGVLGVALDELNQVDELDEQNNRGLVNRDNIRPLDGASGPQAAATPSFAANGSNVPSMLSLPPQ
jgi:hypothetical protein